ncbi:restriction endonuclease subunit S [Methylocaldum sp. GT1TLB]|jgi:restriction endonuclease S subunit|uniref:restriction endonuclease subunit S n=1 Tax=Methylocaldum sp. GT1TLB TaxID=3438965 RepID=UPI003D9FEC38
MTPLYDNPLLSGWNEKPLAQVVQLRRGYTWTKENEIDRPEDGAVPVIRIPNVQDSLDLTDLLYLRDVSPDALERSAVSKGWILFVGSNGSQDRIGDSVLLEEDQPMVFASFLMGMTSKDHDELLPEFLANWMRIHLVHEWFSKTSQQTTGLANYSWGAVKKLPLRFPKDINEQRRIAAALKLADDAIAKAKAELEATRELKRSFARKVLETGLSETELIDSKFWKYPRTWDLVCVKHLLIGMDAGSSPMCESYPAKPGQWGVLKVSAVSWERFDEMENKALPASIEPDLDAEIKVGDIIVSRANTTELCGAVHRVQSLYTRLLLCDKTWRLHPKEDVNPDWLVAVLKHPQARKQIEAIATGTSDSMKNIGKRDFRNAVVPKPSRAEQDRIAESLNAFDAKIEVDIKKVEALQQVKKSLLQNLLTGKIRLPIEQGEALTAPTKEARYG